MPISGDHLSQLRSLLPPARILVPESPEYERHSMPWSLADDQSPSVVLVPESEPELQAVVSFLAKTDLHFAVRSGGCGGASSPDVLISTAAFNSVSFDPVDEVAEVGTGLDWGTVDALLAEQAPGYVVVGARCPYVGVGGSQLMGGLSWLSHEMGLGSDPHNMLDARIILVDGRAIWASTEPDLLWALRGGGGNFGVVTKLKLQARRYTDKIWSGMIQYREPKRVLKQIGKGVAEFAKIKDVKLALHVFVVDFSMQALHGGAPEPTIWLLPFDAHGKEHAESELGFKWALDIEGAEVHCGEMNLGGVHQMQERARASHGKTEGWLAAALIKDEDINEGLVEQCWKWYISTVRDHPKMALSTFALLEIMQEATLMSAKPEETAWPHGALGRRHVLQLSTGSVPSKTEAERSANTKQGLEIIKQAPKTIIGRELGSGDFLPNFTLPYMDLEELFRGNWDRLRTIKTTYDPQGKFREGFFIPPASSPA